MTKNLYIEKYVPAVRLQGGINTALPVMFNAKQVIVGSSTITDLDAQSGTATIAQLLGGVYTHNSKTGAGTLTTPTGAQITTGVNNAIVGTTFDCWYYNRGNQTVTLTAGASGVTLYGTVAIATTKCAIMRFVCTAANTWSVYVNASA